MHRNAARAYAHACKYHWPFFHHPLMPLYHGWNKTHELGRDFDKICAPIPWEKKRGEKVSIYSCIEKFSCSGLKKESWSSLNGFSFSLLDMDFKKNISLLLNPNGMVLLQGLRRKKYHAIPYCAITFESFISRDINLILLMQINFYKCESDICLQR